MSERRGVQRLKWLEENDEYFWSGGSYGNTPVTVPRLRVLDTKEVSVEIAYALIEELHDALLKLDHPVMVITNPILVDK